MDPGIQVRILAPQPKMMGTPLAYVRGEFVPLDQATIPLEDRGFLFADAVYETIVAYHGRPFRLEDHLLRFQRSASEIHLTIEFDLGWLKKIILEGIQRAGFDPAKIYMQLTRGTGPREHVPSRPLKPTLILTFRAHTPVPPEHIEKGIRLHAYPDLRWKRCDIKTTMLLPNVLAKMEALEKGFHDALLVREDGVITECTSAAFGVFRGNTLIFPSLGPQILPSITRKVVIEEAQALGYEVQEGILRFEDLREVDEAFLCSTLQDVTPVVQVDEIQIGDGKPGARTLALLERYRDRLERETKGER